MSTDLNNKMVVTSIKPNELTDVQIQNLNKTADEAITSLIKAKGDIFSEAADSIVNVGLHDQKDISDNIQLMQEKMGNVFYSKEKSSAIDNMSKDVSELQTALAKINPKYIQREARYRILKVIPFFGNYIVNVLKESSTRGLTLKSFADDLTQSIAQSEINIRQDNAQLKVINDDLKKKQVVVSANAYYAERLVEKLSEQVKIVEDITTKNNLNEILARLSSRVQNIRTTENVIQQFFSSIKMSKTNNDYLLDSARETKTNGIMIVNISMAIHVALIRAKNVKDLLEATGEFEGKLLLSNATLINNMVTEIGDIRKNPFVPLKYMEEAIAQLEESIDKTNKLNVEVIETSKNNVGKIKIWTEDLKTKSGELTDIEVKSLEASQVLQLPQGNS